MKLVCVILCIPITAVCVFSSPCVANPQTQFLPPQMLSSLPPSSCPAHPQSRKKEKVIFFCLCDKCYCPCLSLILHRLLVRYWFMHIYSFVRLASFCRFVIFLALLHTSYVSLSFNVVEDMEVAASSSEPVESRLQEEATEPKNDPCFAVPQVSTPVCQNTPAFVPGSFVVPSQPEFSHVSII